MSPTVRPPAVAGMFYPGSPGLLRQNVEGYLEQADPPALDAVPAVVAPHAGYQYSGPVAAYAYKVLAQQPQAPQRVYLLGPSHRVWFRGVAVPDHAAFKTPLGKAPVDTQAVQALLAADGIFKIHNQAHAPEHCLEVHIPFLQVVYPDVPIVPLLFGEVDPNAVGEQLDALIGPQDLIVVSSDLSHYHDNATAHRIDRQFLDALLAGQREGVTRGEACGQAPALALITLAERRGWKPALLDYRTSGDVSGSTGQVVGYAAVAYTEAG